MDLTCLARQGFDSDIFGLDYYRTVRFEYATLAREIESLTGPFMADAKLPAHDIEGAKALMRMGFLKVSVQPFFVFDLSGTPGAPSGDPEGRVDIDPVELDAHAANFPFCRFGLDPHVTEQERIAHQRAWLANTLKSEDILKFREPGAFLSFRIRGDVVAVDLLSAVGPMRGRASLILNRMKSWAAFHGYKRLELTTEDENIPACLLWQKHGFKLEKASVAFHLRKG